MVMKIYNDLGGFPNHMCTTVCVHMCTHVMSVFVNVFISGCPDDIAFGEKYYFQLSMGFEG